MSIAAAMVDSLAAAEAALSRLLHALSAYLAALAVHLADAPVASRLLTDALPSLPTPSHPLHYTLTFLLLALPLPLLLPRLVRRLLPDPTLQLVPPPSLTYDPYADPQSDDFPDVDARPQLVPAGLACLSPSTGDVLGHVAAHLPADVPPAVARARAAQPAWARTRFAQRRAVLRVLRDYIIYYQKDLVDVCVRDTGKTPLDASLGEVLPTLEKIRWLVRDGEAALRPSARAVGTITAHKSAAVEYMPLGVIAAIAPWNYPMHNFLNPVLAALFAGNAVVVKPSELTVFSTLHVCRVVRRALALCGHPPDLVQVLVGGGDVGAALVDADVDKLFFTGSTSVGRLVAERAARRLLPTCLELGGKDPFIVCDDANLAHAAAICLRGVFQNAGQNCIGVERVFVHENVQQRFLDYVLPKVEQIRLGVDMGAMTMGERAVEDIQRLVDDAVAGGARLLAGGKRASVAGKGCFYRPTVLTGVTPDMKIAQEEVFGPVLSMFSWTTDEELVRLVNTCPFGLGSSVFSGSTSRANKILSQLRVGMGNVNDFGTNYLCQSMPFGGTKMSGSDRFAGIEGLRGCCIPKSVTRDRFWGIKTMLPKAFQYPTAANAPEMAAEVNDLIYGSGWISKADNLRNMTGMTLFPSWRPRTVGSG